MRSSRVLPHLPEPAMNRTGTEPAVSADKIADLDEQVPQARRLTAEVEMGEHVGAVARPPVASGRTERGTDAVRQGVDVTFGCQGVPGRNDLGYGAAARPDDGEARRHRLEQHEAELLLPLGGALRGQHQHAR